ncbi:hypothetical protein ACFX2I_021242 [Malus domestica]
MEEEAKTAFSRNRIVVAVGGGAISEQVLEVLVIRHLSRTSTDSNLVASLLELLERVPPLVRTHGGRSVEALFPHPRRDLVPQVPLDFAVLKSPSSSLLNPIKLRVLVHGEVVGCCLEFDKLPHKFRPNKRICPDCCTDWI